MYLGIDLGTTNSVAIIYNDKTNALTPVAIDGVDEVIPSVVNFLDENDPEGIIVGAEAKSGAIIYPESTIMSVKRYMGEDEPLILGSLVKKPEEISAQILKTLKQAAQAQATESEGVETTFDEVVITHPAYFNDKQIYATQQAGYLAGFKTVILLSEPLAAAIEYGYKNGYAQTLLVYDLGGGTFDASVLKVSVDEHGAEVFQELASLGDTGLGGDDFDNELIRYLKKAFKEAHGIDVDDLDDNLERKRVFQKLRAEAESTKKKLTASSKATVAISPLLIYDDMPKSLSLEITRETFEGIIRKYVDRTREIIDETLVRADRTADQISKVILVGGSTLVPMVKRTVAGMIKDPYLASDPAKSVAMGAAIYNYLMHLPGASVAVKQITRQVLGTMAVTDTKTMTRELIPIIPMGSPVPTSVTDRGFTNYGGSSVVNVNIYQWEAGYEEQRQYIGNLSLFGLGSDAQLEVTYSLDENNLFEVHVKDTATGAVKNATFDRESKEQEPGMTTTSAPANSKVNVVFIIDTTGSMDTYIHGVKDRAVRFAEIISERGSEFSLGLVGFGDLYENEKPTVYNFTADVNKFSKQVHKIPRTYGGDIPESSLDALETGVELLKKADDGTNIFILITDAPPHVPTKSGKSVEQIIAMLDQAGVTTYICAREDKESREAFGPVAAHGGKYYNLNQDFFDILDNIAQSITELVRVHGPSR